MPAKKKAVTLQRVYEKLLDHDQQFKSVDQQLTKVINKILDVEDSLSRKITSEIARVEKRIDDLVLNFDKFTKDVETLTQEYHVIAASLRRIEQALGPPEEWSSSVRAEIGSIKRRLASVEDRMSAVETKLN